MGGSGEEKRKEIENRYTKIIYTKIIGGNFMAYLHCMLPVMFVKTLELNIKCPVFSRLRREEGNLSNYRGVLKPGEGRRL